MDAVLQVFAYREPHLSYTLSAIEGQRVPEWLSVDREVWVTPAGPLEDDETWRQAEETATWRARVAPPGKLSARNAAHEAAAREGYDAIVAWDADAPPLREDTLARLCEPISYGAAGANSRPEAEWSILGTLTNTLGWAHDRIQPHFNGQAHAFSTRAWERAGPFDTETVDQTKSGTHVRREEEFAFRRRVEAYGDVRDVPEARVYNDTRRTKCKLAEPLEPLGVEPSDYCERRSGGVTFQPTIGRNQL